MINHITLTGRLTKDIDLRLTKNNKAWAGFTLAVQRNFKDINGNYESDFINCQVFGVGAKFLEKHAKQGSLIGVEGRLQTRKYEKNGQMFYVTEVIVSNVHKLEFNRSENGANNDVDPYEMERFNGGEYQISDEELPF